MTIYSMEDMETTDPFGLLYSYCIPHCIGVPRYTASSAP